MQFKHPEILWFLLLLLIPIIVHLFQLRRFKKTPFTNVAMLQKVVSESRKSSTLKKWLLLCTRLLLLACLVLAFAQPYFASKSALKETETVIFLDDSYSMQAKQNGMRLFDGAVQDLLKNIPTSEQFSLFTNTETYRNVELRQIQNSLLNMQPQNRQLAWDNILLKAESLFSKDSATNKNLIVISDFQKASEGLESTTRPINVHAVALRPDTAVNLSIDSLYLETNTNNQLELGIAISGLEENVSTPISLYNGKQLIAKTTLDWNGNQGETTRLTLPLSEKIDGRVTIEDNALSFDNVFYFNIDEQPKIKVLVINEGDADFLSRIYTEDEFEYKQASLNQLNYSDISNQNLIVLNELESIPSSLLSALQSFLAEGGALCIIPSERSDKNSYNLLVSGILGIQLQDYNNQSHQVTTIAFSHPLFRGVFDQRVTNFDYPQTGGYYSVSGNRSKVLSFENDAPFLIANESAYFFTAPLNKQNSDFQESPLIVPTFYRIGTMSLELPPLYFIIGNDNTVDVPTVLEKDNIIKLKRNDLEIIPLQQSYSNKVEMTFKDAPQTAGIYAVVNSRDTLQQISFNYDRLESRLEYHNLNETNFSSVQSSVPDVFEQLADADVINAYWKWFVIFALLFALVELLIQKLLA